ncbi:helix-turn-helix domain-containing protein [Paenibacillus sp. GCM10023248]|uniref:helix-turn-helix domain-containing protein n=1 Tax=Bacillales TaxID=1385 RepID=UPI0023783D0D|nr:MULTISPECIES: helix-turn-helix domain-containing protein [Bacillales]MDD9265752.1 helix-turn-helix domain-containing protein [Paenibacillus sp. MAHUQ-63]MDR6878993.1 AraC-like DNA-binding protein [Bacillus sp. 3255]
MTYRDVAVKLLSHVYWHRKEQFMYDEDQYPCWTLFAVEDGRFCYGIGDKKGEAGFGDIVLCPPHAGFQRRTLEPLSFHFVQFLWLSEPGSAEEEEGWRGKVTVHNKERLISNYDYLKQLSGWDEESTLHKQHMVNDLLRLVQIEKIRKDESDTESDALMDTARKYMMDHAYASLSLLELAVSLGLTPVQFTRRFRKASGQTPSEFVNEMRLTRARHLLEGTTLTLDAIAARCGYENGFYLSRVFTQKIGMPPSVYRSMYRV